MSHYPSRGPQVATEPPGVPTSCPTCRSADLTTKSRTITVDTYWRCGACGEVWNARRLREGARYAGYRPFGR